MASSSPASDPPIYEDQTGGPRFTPPSKEEREAAWARSAARQAREAAAAVDPPPLAAPTPPVYTKLTTPYPPGGDATLDDGRGGKLIPLVGPSAAPPKDPRAGKIGDNLAPFNPTMPYVVETALAMLSLTAEDVLYDLGCGDGRVMIAAAQAVPGLRCIGVEYDLKYATRAQEAVDAAGLGDRITVRRP